MFHFDHRLFHLHLPILPVDSGNIWVNGKAMGKEMDMLKNAGIIIEEPGYITFVFQMKNELYKLVHTHYDNFYKLLIKCNYHRP